ncbi:MAG: LapA family protein [Calditrichaeota bacterium]|nr:MAG: LapA family protein [Calditrichota bacterium]
MWAIRWFLAVVLILVVLGFALQNSSQEVSVVFVPNVWQYSGVQLWMVIYASFGLGVIFWLIVSVFQVLQLKAEIRRLRRSNEEIQHELDSLRNLPIGDDDTGFDIKEEA